MGNKRKTGWEYEKKAAEYLRQQGFLILCQNFYSRYGELDIIAQDGEYLVFIEVKYRKDASCGSPLEAVGVKKQRHICRTAFAFCTRNGYRADMPCRFDVVAIAGDGEVLHIKNAFDFQI